MTDSDDTPDDDLRRLYRGMKSTDLLSLSAAFILDRPNCTDQAFVDRRLALIRAVLGERDDAAVPRD